MLQCDLERVLHDRERFLPVAAAEQDGALRPERGSQRSGQPLGLGDVERELRSGGGPLEIAAEPVCAGEHRGEHREILVGLVSGDHLVCMLQPRERFVSTTGERDGASELVGGSGRGVGVALGIVDRDRLFDQPLRGVGIAREAGHVSRAHEQLGVLERHFRQLRRLLEVALRFGRRGKRLGSFTGSGERQPGPPLDLGRVDRVGIEPVRLDEVRRDDLGQLVLGRRGGEMLGGREVARAPLPSGECLVRDVADEVLQEAVLAVLRRARVGLKRDDLLAHERMKQCVELRLAEPGECGERCARKRLSEHGSVLQQPALLRRQTVETGGDQRMQGFRHLECLDLADGSVDGAFLDERAAVEQHPHGLDGIERNTLRAGKDLIAQTLRQAGNEAAQQLIHGLL